MVPGLALCLCESATQPGLKIEDQLARPTTLIVGPDGVVTWAYVGRSIFDRSTLPEVLAVAMGQR